MANAALRSGGGCVIGIAQALLLLAIAIALAGGSLLAVVILGVLGVVCEACSLYAAGQ